MVCRLFYVIPVGMEQTISPGRERVRPPSVRRWMRLRDSLLGWKSWYISIFWAEFLSAVLLADRNVPPHEIETLLLDLGAGSFYRGIL